MSKLLSHYEARIKNFVLKMSESPYLIKKYNRIYTPKSVTQIPVTQTFYQKNAFSFKKFKSDRERINEILEKNAVLEEYYKKMKVEKERIKKIYQIKFAPKLIQPNMHFQYKNGESIINRKLANKIKELSTKSKSVDNYNIEETNEENENSNDNASYINTQEENNNKINNNTNKNVYDLTEEQIMRKNLHNKIIEDRKNMINTRKLLMNLEGGNLEKKNHKYSLGELYRKTEFKAMENLNIFKTSTMNQPILKKWKKEDEEKQINIKLINLTEENNNNNKRVTRNNKSNREIFNKKIINTMKDNDNPKLKKIYSMDEIDINNNSEIYSNMDNKDLYNFNSNIKDKPYIEKRRLKLSEDKKILNNFNLTKVVSHTNPLLYKLYFLDVKSKDNNIGINEDQFNQIKKMAFEEKKSSVYVTSNENDKFEEDAHNDELNIFNKKNKKQSVDKLVEKILTDTNWHLKNNYKSKYDLLKK
jgi:hypothetical protein